MQSVYKNIITNVCKNFKNIKNTILFAYVCNYVPHLRKAINRLRKINDPLAFERPKRNINH